jgi:integrase
MKLRRIALAVGRLRGRCHQRNLLRLPAAVSEEGGLLLSGVHIFRRSAAKLWRDAGESIEDVSRLLDHTPLAVTTTYLRRLERQEDHPEPR